MKTVYDLDQLPEGGTLPEPPQRSDGGLWPVLLVTGSTAVYADTNTELLDELIDGYSSLNDDDALWARYQLAVAVGTAVQASLVDAAADTKLSEDELTVLFTEKTTPFAGDRWRNEDVPLVLIESDYAPFTAGRPVPLGNIVWLRPVNEAEFLASLDNLGAVIYRVADPGA